MQCGCLRSQYFIFGIQLSFRFIIVSFQPLFRMSGVPCLLATLFFLLTLFYLCRGKNICHRHINRLLSGLFRETNNGLTGVTTGCKTSRT